MEPIYKIKEDATYETEIRALQDADLASATGTFNPLFETMINNTHAVKKEVEAMKQMTKWADVVQIDNYSTWEPPEYPVSTSSWQASGSPTYSRGTFNGMWNPSISNTYMTGGTLIVSNPEPESDADVYIRNYTSNQWCDWIKLEIPSSDSSLSAIASSNKEAFSITSQMVSSTAVDIVKNVQVTASVRFDKQTTIPITMLGMVIASVSNSFKPIDYPNKFHLLNHVLCASSSTSANVILNGEIMVYINSAGNICLVSTSGRSLDVPAKSVLHISGSYQIVSLMYETK